jgi:hypothetical protein
MSFEGVVADESPSFFSFFPFLFPLSKHEKFANEDDPFFADIIRFVDECLKYL